MAVMTTTLSNDGLILEQKTQPVPSSEKMALDLDINGTTKRDETNLDFEIPNPSVTPPDFDSSPNLFDAAETRMKQNDEAATANDSVMEDVVIPDTVKEDTVVASAVVADELVVADNKSFDEAGSAKVDEVFGSAEVVDEAPAGAEEKPTTTTSTKTISTSVAQPTSTETSQLDSSFDTLATTTVPPLVEAQESDLRESAQPASQIEAEAIKATKHAMDLNADSELANGFDNTAAAGNASTEHVTNGEGAEAGSQMMNSQFEDSSAAELAQSSEAPIPNQSSNAPPSPGEGDSQKTHNIENLQIESASQQPAQPEQAASHEPAADFHMSEAENASQDVDMGDDLFGEAAPPPPSGNKVAREREEDTDMDAPEAKRMRVGSSMNGDVAVEDDDLESPGRVITPDLLRTLRTTIANAKKGNIGKSFKGPVATLWPALAVSYRERIEKPMDLTLIDRNLQDGVYRTLGDFKADVELIYENCVAFNGLENNITVEADKLRTYLFNKLTAPPPAPKTKARSRKNTPNRDLYARRPSRAAHTSPPAAAAKIKAEPFPLDPVTQTPVIRRDSALDGRPKRDVHPPKPKDIFTQPPSKNRRKNAAELKFCDQLLQDIMKPKNTSMNQFFMEPVDVVALNIPHYLKEIKKPMDLGTIAQKLSNNFYMSAKDFESDFRLMLKNCFQFNPSENLVHQKGRDLERYFNKEWEGKARFMANHAGPSQRHVEPDSEDEQSDDGEEEEPASYGGNESDRVMLLSKVMEEQGKLLEMGKQNAPKKMLELQETIVTMSKAALQKLDDDMAASKKKGGKKQKAPAKPVKRAAPPPPPKKAKKPKSRYMGHAEKEIISNGIGRLDDKSMQIVISWIRADVDGLDTIEDNEMELDIDAVSDACLNKLFDLVVAKVPGIADHLDAPDEPSHRSAPAPKPAAKRKNKPMGKLEQENKIAQLQQVVGNFGGGQAGGGSGRHEAPTQASQAAMGYGAEGGPAIEQEEDTSGDEEESDSEEE